MGTTDVAAASDLEEGLTAYEEQDYLTALAKFCRAAVMVAPSLHEFLVAARPRNPDCSDEDLFGYWRQRYGQTYWRAARAQVNLGMMYALGHGVPQDFAQAVLWWRKAARAGNATAQYNLGVAYDRGEGVPQDYTQARFWYQQAAAAGHSAAQNNLGFMYDYGRGVPQDHIQAHHWYTLAVASALNEEDRQVAAKNRDRLTHAYRLWGVQQEAHSARA